MRLSLKVSREAHQRRVGEIGRPLPGTAAARLKINLSAPAIWPEIAAEAPTTGVMSP